MNTNNQPNPNSANREYREYICGLVSDRERLYLQYNCFKPRYQQLLARIFDDTGYDLAATLTSQLTSSAAHPSPPVISSSGSETIEQLSPKPGSKVAPARAKPSVYPAVNLLDIGCGEGLFLHEIAASLEERGLLNEKVGLFGLDIAATAIATADEYSRLANPPRPYLNFYTHDITKPLEENWELHARLKPPFQSQFDFISATMVMAYVPQAKTVLEHYYKTYLKPGGVLYLRELVTEQVHADIHPVLQPFTDAIMQYIRGINGGLNLAALEALWLREWGAEIVWNEEDHVPTGGTTPIGKQMLRNRVMIMQNSAPQLIKYGLVTQAQYDQAMAVIFREIGPHWQGEMLFVDTLARKPKI